MLKFALFDKSSSSPHNKDVERTKTYTPGNIDFLSTPAECRIWDWGKQEFAAIENINRVYGMLAALSADIQTFDPLAAHEAVEASLARFWAVHHSDISLPTWTESDCWEVVKRYWI